MTLTNPLHIARFWSKVRVSAETNCWPWQGPVGHNGYGLFSIGSVHFRAHRLSAEFFGATIEPGQLVMHSCDNPPCVNPVHLIVGTQADNMRDMVAKGRHVWSTGRSKLTAQQVIEIRRRLAAGEMGTALASEYRVHPQTIHHIKSRRYWPNL